MDEFLLSQVRHSLTPLYWFSCLELENLIWQRSQVSRGDFGLVAGKAALWANGAGKSDYTEIGDEIFGDGGGLQKEGGAGYSGERIKTRVGSWGTADGAIRDTTSAGVADFFIFGFVMLLKEKDRGFERRRGLETRRVKRSRSCSFEEGPAAFFLT